MSILTVHTVWCDAEKHVAECPQWIGQEPSRREVQKLARSRGWYVTADRHLSPRCWTAKREKARDAAMKRAGQS